MGTLELLKYRDYLLKKLLNTTDVSILNKIETVFKNNENEEDFNELPLELQELLLNSEEDIKQEIFVSHKEVMKSFRK